METDNIQGQSVLVEKVISGGFCVKCGACVGLCPYFNYFDGKVVVMDKCQADTFRCLQLCPRAEYEGTSLHPIPEKEPIGPYRHVLVARAIDEEIRNRAQYGGTVSAILMEAFEKGDIRSAVLTDAGDRLSPGGLMARNREEVLDCAGSRYSGSASLSVLNRAISQGEDKIGVVGLPCQMEALARMERMKPDGEERSARVSLKVGLFCTWALDYRKLKAFLREAGVGGAVLKYDIPPPPADKFMVRTEKGWVDFPLSEVRPLIQKGCTLCQDMTAIWADLSVGTVEGREGWNTVIIRTETGEELIEEAVKAGKLETGPLPEENFEHLKEASRNKRKRAKQAELGASGSGGEK